jgi:hypothetical protein
MVRMMFVALGLVGFGVADLARRWPKSDASKARVAGAAFAGAIPVAVLAAFGGTSTRGVAVAGLIAVLVLVLWEGWERKTDESGDANEDPETAWALVVPAVSIATLFALSGSTGDVRGDLARWYGDLGFPFAGTVPAGQALMAVGVSFFLLATGNRVVRLALAAAGSPPAKGEGKLRGGRLIGPMERLLVAGALVAGGLAGAGFVIAAKGLLRFRELKPDDGDDTEGGASVDEITEYFLVGTFASILLACAGSLLVLGAG